MLISCLISLLLVYINSSKPALTALLDSQAPVITALTKGCKSVEVVKSVEDVPEGCASELVNADVTVHLMVRVRLASTSVCLTSHPLALADPSPHLSRPFLQGKIDLDAEAAKLAKKVDLTKASIAKLQALTEQPGYADKIPQEVRDGNGEKLRTMGADVENLERSMAMFLRLK